MKPLLHRWISARSENPFTSLSISQNTTANIQGYKGNSDQTILKIQAEVTTK